MGAFAHPFFKHNRKLLASVDTPPGQVYEHPSDDIILKTIA